MTTLEKADQLARTVKVGDEFISGKERMKVTQVSPTGCTLGMAESYTWAEFQRYIQISAIRTAPPVVPKKDRRDWTKNEFK